MSERKETAGIVQNEEYIEFPDYIDPGFRLMLASYQFDAPVSVTRAAIFRKEIFWIRVMQGEVSFEVDGSTVFVSAGETLFINSRHFNAFRGVINAPASFRLAAAMPDTVNIPMITKQIEKMCSDDSFSSIVIRPVSALFSYDLDALFDLYRHKPDAYEFELASHFLSMLRQVIRIYRHTNPDDTVHRNMDLESLREMLSYIGENYRDEITVDQIAAAGKMSRSRCTRLFRRYLQESPIEHVQKFRLERSVYYINNTDLQFSEIAGRCGFNQQSYFNRLFIRHFNMTPKQMRSASILKRRQTNREI